MTEENYIQTDCVPQTFGVHVNDPVNHPQHYTDGKIECIEAIESSMNSAQYRGYLKGCALKYIWRYDKKGNPVQDLNKAIWYLDRLITSLEEGDERDH